MTGTAWLAIGATIASLLGTGLDPASLVLLASAFGVAVAGRAAGAGGGGGTAKRRAGTADGTSGPGAAPGASRRWLLRAPPVRVLAPIAVGTLAIALRLALTATSPASLPGLPDGSGPWIATVTTISSPRDGSQVATLQLDPGRRSERPEPQRELPPIAVAATLPRFPAIEPGDEVRVDGRVEAPPEGPYGDYLRRVGVAGTIRSRSLTVIGRDDDPGARLEALRRAAGDALAAALPEPEAGLAAGIVIGLRDRVDRDLAADFTTVGASHVVAISGWNIAIVAATIAALAGRLGRRRRSILLVVAIVGYVLFAGASASVVRAAVMAGVVLVARESGRAGRATTALGWAVALLLLADPALVLDAGFQLSTLATGGILAWATPWTERLRLVARGRLPGWLAESLGVSLAAQLATLPVVLLTFGRLALISPIVNLAIVPLVAPAMAAAMVALIGGLIALAGGPGVIATLAGLPAWALLTAMCTVIRAAADLPFANVSFGPPWTVVAGAASAAAILGARPAGAWLGPRRRRTRSRGRDTTGSATRVATAPVAKTPDPARATSGSSGARPRATRLSLALLVAATASVGLAFAHRADGTTRITVLDVGQGDSILVEGGRGGRMLVDAGPDPDRLLVELDRRLPPWDRRIDVLVLTHPHEDHVAGMPLLLERYRIGRVFETGMRGPGPGYRAFAADLARPGAPPVALLATGARISVDDLHLRVLWPDPGRVPREPPDAGRGINDVSVVFLGEVAGRRILLTGDVEDDVDPILATRDLPRVDILKVAHHGSATASTPAFLDRVRPAIAVVSAGAGNPYGHPARSTIDRLKGTGARVLRTDTDGSVSIAISPAGAIAVATSGARAAALVPRLARGISSALVDPAAFVTAATGARAAPTGSSAPAPGVLVQSVAFTCAVPITARARDPTLAGIPSSG